MKWAIFLLTSAIWAAPTIREIHPRGAQTGTRFTLLVRGDGLTPDAKIESRIPGGISRMVPAKAPETPNSELPFLVELRKDAPTGLYPIRVITSDGVSNVLLFSVSPFPEVEEAEIELPKQRNDTPEAAQSLAAPIVVNGTLTGPDIDFYALNVKVPQKLVFEVEARRAGSAIDPALEIFDAAGKPVSKVDDSAGAGVDCRTEVAFAKPGVYRVRVHDSRYSDQAVNFYRLKIGAYPFAESAFPLGWKKGEDTEVTLSGGNLTAPIQVKAAQELRVPGSASLPIPFLLSDTAEVVEDGSGKLPAGAVVNGKIGRPGEIDRFKLAVKPGEQWMFELKAATLGASQLDALVTIESSAGKKLASRDDTVLADPAFPFTVPEGVNEITVAVEDLLGRGGPGFAYRLLASRQGPDFVVALATPFVNVPAGGTAQIAVVMQRRGYDGPVRVLIEGLPDGFKASGGNIPGEAAAQNFNNDNAGFRTATAIVTIAAPEDAKPLVRELQVIAVGGGMRRIARSPGLVTPVRGAGQRPVTATWLDDPLILATSKPTTISLSSPTPLVRVSQGFEYSIPYRLRRRPGAPQPGRVSARSIGAVGNLRILGSVPGPTPDTGTIVLSTTFATPVTTFDVILDTQVEMNGRPVTISSPAIEVEVVEGYGIELAAMEIGIDPGRTAEIRGRILREPTFEGTVVKLEASELPDHVECTPVQVAEEQRDFAMACRAGAQAAAGTYTIQLRSVAPDTGRKTKDEYKIADMPAKLVVGGKAQAAR